MAYQNKLKKRILFRITLGLLLGCFFLIYTLKVVGREIEQTAGDRAVAFLEQCAKEMEESGSLGNYLDSSCLTQWVDGSLAEKASDFVGNEALTYLWVDFSEYGSRGNDQREKFLKTDQYFLLDADETPLIFSAEDYCTFGFLPDSLLEKMAELETYDSDDGEYSYEINAWTDLTGNEIAEIEMSWRDAEYPLSSGDNSISIGDRIKDSKKHSLSLGIPYLKRSDEEWQTWCEDEKLRTAVTLGTDTAGLRPEWSGKFGKRYLTIWKKICLKEDKIISLGMNVRISTLKLVAICLRYWFAAALILMLAVAIALWRTYREMEEMLQYENSRRLELFRIIAHEMKTPVALIKGITELLSEHLVPEKQDYYLSKISREAEHMDIMVADLLKDMKIASVGEKGILTDIDLGKLLQELLNEMDISAEQYILKTEGSMVVEADAQYMKRAFGVILDNAVRYQSGKEAIRITVSENAVSIENRIDIDTGRKPEPATVEAAAELLRYHKQSDGIGLQLAKMVFERYHMLMDIESDDEKFAVTVEKEEKAEFFLFGKRQKEILRVVEIHDSTAGMPSMATNRNGFSMSFATSYLAGEFEKQDGSRIRLLVPDKIAAGLRPGNSGTAVFGKKKLYKFYS